MVLNPWEYSYNGVVFGGSTSYGVTNIEGLDSPELKTVEVEKALEHGGFFYAEYLSTRTITISGYLMENVAVDFENKITDLKGAFVPQGSSLPFLFYRPTREYRIAAKPSRPVTFPITLDYSLGYTEWSVELTAQDPRIYDATLTSQTITSGGTSVTNAGNFPTYANATIVGPSTNPKVQNFTTGEDLTVNTTLSSSETMTIDFDAREVRIGGVKRYDLVDQRPQPQWWDINPGTSTIKFTGGGTCTLTFRSAWI